MSARTAIWFEKKDVMYYVHSVICLAIMFGFGRLAPFEPLTPLGMNLIGIFLGVLYGWIFIDIIWPSIAGLLAMTLIGGSCSTKASATPLWS